MMMMGPFMKHLVQLTDEDAMKNRDVTTFVFAFDNTRIFDKLTDIRYSTNS